MADPTPEEPIGIEIVRKWCDYSTPEEWLSIAVERPALASLAGVITEEVAHARSKAFEEAARICSDAEKSHRDFCNTFDHGTPECGRASVAAHTAYMLAEKIRARAKEAPRGS